MIRVRRVSARRLWRPAAYEIDWEGPADADPDEASASVVTTREPLRDLGAVLTHEDALALVRAADEEWHGQSADWVSLDDVIDRPTVCGTPCRECADGTLVFMRFVDDGLFLECDECGTAFEDPAHLRLRMVAEQQAAPAGFATISEIEQAGWGGYVARTNSH